MTGPTPAEMFANRLRKRWRTQKSWAARAGVSCLRVYDRDIPEVPLTVDRYEDAAVVSDRRKFDDELADQAWLPAMLAAVATELAIAPSEIFVKQRRPQGHREAGQQYERVAEQGAWRTTFSATDPSSTRLSPVRPWLPITTRSKPGSSSRTVRI